MTWKSVFKIVLILYITIMATVLSLRAQADEFKPIEMQDVYVNYKQFFQGGRDPLITNNGLDGRLLDKELNLHFDMDVLKYGYWHNMVHSMTDQDERGHGQFRVVGWNFQAGVHLGSYLDVQYEHYSQHLLDASLPYAFPVQDSIGIVLHLYRGRNSGSY